MFIKSMPDLKKRFMENKDPLRVPTAGHYFSYCKFKVAEKNRLVINKSTTDTLFLLVCWLGNFRVVAIFN